MDTLKNLFSDPFKTLLVSVGAVAASVYFVGLMTPVTYAVAGVGALLTYRAHSKKG